MNKLKRTLTAILLIATVFTSTACKQAPGNTVTPSPEKTLPPLGTLEETDEPWETDEITEPPVSGELISNELDGMTEREKVVFLASEAEKITYTERYEKFRANAVFAGNDFGETDIKYNYAISQNISEINIGRDDYARHSVLNHKENGESYDDNYYFYSKQTESYSDGYMYVSYVPHKKSDLKSFSYKSEVSLNDYLDYQKRLSNGFPVFDLDKEYAGASVSVLPFITGTKWVIYYEFTEEIPAELDSYVTAFTYSYYTRFHPDKVRAEVTVDILTHAVEQMKCYAVYKTEKGTGESMSLTMEISSTFSPKAKGDAEYIPQNSDAYQLCGDLRYYFLTERELCKLFYCHGNNSFVLNDMTKTYKNGFLEAEITFSDTVSYGIKKGRFVFAVDGGYRFQTIDRYMNVERSVKYNGKTLTDQPKEGLPATEEINEQSALYYIAEAFNGSMLYKEELKSLSVVKDSNGGSTVSMELFVYYYRDYVYNYLDFVPKVFDIISETIKVVATFDNEDNLKSYTYIFEGEYNHDNAKIKFNQRTTVSDFKEADVSKIPLFSQDSEL